MAAYSMVYISENVEPFTLNKQQIIETINKEKTGTIPNKSNPAKQKEQNSINMQESAVLRVS